MSRKTEDEKRRKENEEMEECTFKPRFINKAVMNKNLASKKARNY